MYDLKVKLTFIESVLGLTPGDPEIYRSYISRAFSRTPAVCSAVFPPMPAPP